MLKNNHQNDRKYPLYTAIVKNSVWPFSMNSFHTPDFPLTPNPVWLSNHFLLHHELQYSFNFSPSHRFASMKSHCFFV